MEAPSLPTITSVQGHIVLSQWKTHCLGDTLTLPSDLLQPFIDWGIKVLFPTLGTYPGWDMIHINCLATKMESGPDMLVFNGSLAKLTRIDAHLLSPSSYPLAYAVMMRNTPEVRNLHTTDAPRPSRDAPLIS